MAGGLRERQARTDPVPSLEDEPGEGTAGQGTMGQATAGAGDGGAGNHRAGEGEPERETTGWGSDHRPAF